MGGGIVSQTTPLQVSLSLRACIQGRYILNHSQGKTLEAFHYYVCMSLRNGYYRTVTMTYCYVYFNVPVALRTGEGCLAQNKPTSKTNNFCPIKLVLTIRCITSFKSFVISPLNLYTDRQFADIRYSSHCLEQFFSLLLTPLNDSCYFLACYFGITV